jgi:benzodiazapine receptor
VIFIRKRELPTCDVENCVQNAIIRAMNETVKTSDRMNQVGVLVATFATIAVNTAAAAGLINGRTPEVVSAKFPTAITPAGYTFTIWALIYTGMIAFSVYQMLPSKTARFSSIRRLYLATCILNCGWIVLWHREMIGACLAVIILLDAALVVICYRLRETGSFVDAILSKAVFGTYCGWVTCAMLINLLIFLGLAGFDAKARYLAVPLMIFAVITSFVIRWKFGNYLYPLAVAWALTGIAIEQSGDTAIVLTAAFGTVACLVTAGSVVTTLKDSTSE